LHFFILTIILDKHI